MTTRFSAALFLFVSLCSSASLSAAHPRDARKRTVDNFLTAWLVQKNISVALNSFHKRALSQIDVLDDCIREDYITESEKNDPKAIRRGVTRALKEGSLNVRGKRLHEILFVHSRETPEQYRERRG